MSKAGAERTIEHARLAGLGDSNLGRVWELVEVGRVIDGLDLGVNGRW